VPVSTGLPCGDNHIASDAKGNTGLRTRQTDSNHSAFGKYLHPFVLEWHCVFVQKERLLQEIQEVRKEALQEMS
jgi:hypothetical protein